jgi:chromosome segregation ATPase
MKKSIMEINCQEFLKSAEEIVTQEVIEREEYLAVIEKHKEACEKIDQLTSKKRERNQKLLNVQTTLRQEHEEAMTALKQKLKDTQRELIKYKTALAEREKELKKYTTHHTALTAAQSFLSPAPAKPVEKKVSPPIPQKKENKNNSLKIVEVEKVIAEHFPKEKSEELLGEIIESASKTLLNFKKISVTYFEENKLIVLQGALSRKIKTDLNLNSPLLVNGVTSRVLKNNFQFIHEAFAKKVLEASNVQRGIFKFFENYTVEDNENTRWNSFSITRFMTAYLEDYQHIEKYNNELKTLEKLKVTLKEKEAVADEENQAEVQKLSSEVERGERTLQTLAVKKQEAEINLRRVTKQYDLLLNATTDFLMETRIVK